MFWTPGTGYESEQYIRIYSLSIWWSPAIQAVCSVSSQTSSWNCQIPLVTVQDKSMFRGRLVNMQGHVRVTTEDQRWRLDAATQRDLFPRYIVQSRRGWYAYGSSCLARAQESRSLYTMMTLMSLSYCLLIAKPWLWKVLREKGKRREN